MRKTFFKLLTMLGVVFFSLTSCSAKLNREKLKSQINKYIDKIEVGDIITSDFEIAHEIVNEKVDTINEIEYKTNSKRIKEKIKKEVSSLIVDKKLEEKIVNDFKNYEDYYVYQREIPYSNSYGTYGETTVLFFWYLYVNQTVLTITIGGVDFFYNVYFDILAYNNGNFYSFYYDADIIIDNNILTVEDLLKVQDIHERICKKNKQGRY